jgi:hypothetical protein
VVEDQQPSLFCLSSFSPFFYSRHFFNDWLVCICIASYQLLHSHRGGWGGGSKHGYASDNLTLLLLSFTVSLNIHNHKKIIAAVSTALSLLLLFNGLPLCKWSNLGSENPISIVRLDYSTRLFDSIIRHDDDDVLPCWRRYKTFSFFPSDNVTEISV